MNQIQKNTIKVGAFISLIAATPFAASAINNAIDSPQITHEVAAVQGKYQEPGSIFFRPKYALAVNHHGFVRGIEVSPLQYTSTKAVELICLAVHKRQLFNDEYFLASKDECGSQNSTVSIEKDSVEVGDTHQNQAIVNSKCSLGDTSGDLADQSSKYLDCRSQEDMKKRMTKDVMKELSKNQN